jgi:hypothetical protein
LFVIFVGSEQYPLVDSSQLLWRSLMLEQELLDQKARETGKEEILDFSLDYQVFI